MMCSHRFDDAKSVNKCPQLFLLTFLIALKPLQAVIWQQICSEGLLVLWGRWTVSLQSPHCAFICILDQIIITLCIPRTSLSVMDDWCSLVIFTKVLCPAGATVIYCSAAPGSGSIQGYHRLISKILHTTFNFLTCTFYINTRQKQ